MSAEDEKYKHAKRVGIGMLAVLGLVVLVSIISAFRPNNSKERNRLIAEFTTAYFATDFENALTFTCLPRTPESVRLLVESYEALGRRVGTPLAVSRVNNVAFQITGPTGRTDTVIPEYHEWKGHLSICPDLTSGEPIEKALFDGL